MANPKYKISEERILQISNDIAEGMCKATRAELIEVVRYFQHELGTRMNNDVTRRMEIGIELLKLANECLKPNAH